LVAVQTAADGQDRPGLLVEHRDCRGDPAEDGQRADQCPDPAGCLAPDVFAPTDEAFAKLPAGTLDALLMDKAKLTAILTYHVVPGKVMAADVVKLKEAKTVQGQMIKIDTAMGVKVDGANVVKTDIACSNGVIHVIDSVILPK
jgi:hypothetical protein